MTSILEAIRLRASSDESSAIVPPVVARIVEQMTVGQPITMRDFTDARGQFGLAHFSSPVFEACLRRSERLTGEELYELGELHDDLIDAHKSHDEFYMRVSSMAFQKDRSYTYELALLLWGAYELARPSSEIEAARVASDNEYYG